MHLPLALQHLPEGEVFQIFMPSLLHKSKLTAGSFFFMDFDDGDDDDELASSVHPKKTLKVRELLDATDANKDIVDVSEYKAWTRSVRSSDPLWPGVSYTLISAGLDTRFFSSSTLSCRNPSISCISGIFQIFRRRFNGELFFCRGLSFWGFEP